MNDVRISRYEIKKDSVQLNEVDDSITFKARIAKSGVLDYYEYDFDSGDFVTVKEANLPEDIFDNATLETAKNIIVTNEHPYNLINSNTARDEFRGFSLSDVEVEDDKFISVSIKVFDKDLQSDILAGRKNQVSVGKIVKVLDEQGEFEGEAYDKRQTQIRFNHIAIVGQGRAGDEVKVLTDSKNKIRFDYKPEIKNKEEETMAEEVVSKEEYNKLKGKYDAMEKEKVKLEGEKTTLEEKLDNLEKEKSKMDGINEATSQKIKELEEKLDATVSREEFNSKLNLIREVEKLTNEKVDANSTNRELMEMVIKKDNAEMDLSGKDDLFVEGMYEVVKGNLNVVSKTDTDIEVKKNEGKKQEVKIDYNGKTLKEIREEEKKLKDGGK